MQLNKLKARAETAQAIVQRPRLLLPKDNVPTSDTTIAGNTQHKLQRESRWRTIANWLAGNPKVAFGLGIVGFFFLITILGPIVVQHNPNAFTSDVLQPPSVRHWLGTTQTGQDAFAQVVVATRVSVLLGSGAGFLPAVASVVICLPAGYVGGLDDDVRSLSLTIV